MEVKTNDIYSEVYSILNLLGDSYINKIPRKALDIIKNERNMNYNPKYDFSIDINSQDIKRETKAMIALLRLSYWCTSEEEKIKLSNQFKENDFQKKTAALQIKLKTAIPPLYDRFIEKFPSRDCDLHFINGILGVETLRILYPFIFE